MTYSKAQTGAWARSFLALGRVWHLPTVWSNCLAGWLLSDGGSSGDFLVLCMGATLLYMGSVFFHDACHATLGSAGEHLSPTGGLKLSQQTLWLLSLGWSGMGDLVLATLGRGPAFFAILLTVCLVLHGLLDKVVRLSPVLMGSSRLLLYLVAGSAATRGLQGLTIWSGLALGIYVTGVYYLERERKAPSLMQRGAALLLAVPFVLAALVNGPGYRLAAFFFSSLLAGWLFWCLRYSLWTEHRNIGLTVSGLLPGIVLVDLLAVGGGSIGLMLVFLLWFAASLFFQRLV
jgi:hypothetical protein